MFCSGKRVMALSSLFARIFPALNPDKKVLNTAKTQKLNAKPIKDKKELHSVVLGSLRSI
ncbi:MAG: hypothetical protein B6D35_14675 [Candidatus Brocadia sp. UTAMX2]|jgi:hypothetical protein|nr:MAG: hypothetical protein B6D35_14675 [Candidatus Brocadia sp. UTAMX2]